jgi:hypothetical protein
VRDEVLIDSDTLLMTDFMNLKIKSAQFFRVAHKDRVCVNIFVEMNVVNI